MCESIGHRPLRGRCPKGLREYVVSTRYLFIFNKKDVTKNVGKVVCRRLSEGEQEGEEGGKEEEAKVEGEEKGEEEEGEEEVKGAKEEKEEEEEEEEEKEMEKPKCNQSGNLSQVQMTVNGGKKERTGKAHNKEKQVAQGQYVVSDTRCPALHDCKSE